MAILFRSTPAATARWRPLLASLLPEHEIRYWPDIGDKAAIEYALVWQPEPGLLASLPRLKMIVGLGAGVPHKAIARQLEISVSTVQTHLERVRYKYAQAGRPIYHAAHYSDRVREDGFGRARLGRSWT